MRENPTRPTVVCEQDCCFCPAGLGVGSPLVVFITVSQAYVVTHAPPPPWCTLTLQVAADMLNCNFHTPTTSPAPPSPWEREGGSREEVDTVVLPGVLHQCPPRLFRLYACDTIFSAPITGDTCGILLANLKALEKNIWKRLHIMSYYIQIRPP